MATTAEYLTAIADEVSSQDTLIQSIITALDGRSAGDMKHETEEWTPASDVKTNDIDSKIYHNLDWKPKIITIWREDGKEATASSDVASTCFGGQVIDLRDVDVDFPYTIEMRKGTNGSISISAGGSTKNRVTDEYFLLPSGSSTWYFRAGHTYTINYWGWD